MTVHVNNNMIIINDKDETTNIIDYSFIDIEIYTILLEKDSSIVYISKNCTNILNFSSNNEKLYNVIDNYTYEEIRKLMIECIFTSKQVINEINIGNRFYRVLVSPILDKKLNIKYLLLNLYDISLNKRYEDEIKELKIKLDESNSIKSLFLSNISHELRTPMNSIIGFSNMLIDKCGSDNQRYIKSLNSNAKYLDELLCNILDYAKLESKEFELLYENFSINELFDELNEIFEDLNYKKNLNFVKLEFIKYDEDVKVISDYLRLKQVLFNIISNSIKFTEKGYIKIYYNITKKDIIFVVEDTGIGIQENKIKFIFNRFWQNDSSSHKGYRGVGLGLAISKHIVKMLSGDIWVKSTINKGSEFFIKIPFEEIKHDDTNTQKHKNDFSDKSVLIIDELPEEYSLLSIYLKTLNINVISANSGKEGTEILKKQKDDISIVFIDYSLPDMKIYELSQKLKDTNNKCKIILKSAIKVKKNKYLDHILRKPINKNKLLTLLNIIWQK
jgi:signal transduction histidine kinase